MYCAGILQMAIAKNVSLHAAVSVHVKGGCYLTTRSGFNIPSGSSAFFTARIMSNATADL